MNRQITYKGVATYRNALKRQLRICNELCRNEFGLDKISEFTKNVFFYFENFSNTLPEFKNKQNRKNFSFGPLILAVHKTLSEQFKYTTERQVEFLTCILNHLTLYNLKHSSFLLQLAYKNVGKIGFISNFMADFFHYIPELDGWSAVLRKIEGTYLAADMTSCGIHQWLSMHNAQQFCKIYCATDYIVADYMPWITLTREQTIAHGDGICSFRYTVVKKS
jgi:hypothetical protein